MNSQVEKFRPFLENIQLPLAIIDLVLEYVQLLSEGQYKWGDLLDIPVDNLTYTFMLKMRIETFDSETAMSVYEGEVDVVRINMLRFKFTVSGTHYVVCQDWLLNDDMMFKICHQPRGSRIILFT